MSQRKNPRSGWTIIVILILIALLVILWYKYCNKPRPQDTVNIVNHGVKKDTAFSWNVLFNEGTSKGDRESTIDNICSYVRSYYDSINQVRQTDFAPNCNRHFCPC